MSQSENRKIIDTEHAKGNKVVLFAGAHGIAEAYVLANHNYEKLAADFVAVLEN